MTDTLRRYLMLLLLLIGATTTWAQNVCIVSGRITDADTRKPISQVTVQCTMGGRQYTAVSNAQGRYTLKLGRTENPSLLFTHVSYQPTTRTVNCINNKSVTMDLTMKAASNTLKEVVIKKNPAMIAHKDTITYRAADYKIEENSDLMKLILRMQGFSLQDNVLKYNGETIGEIQLNGREYFKGDVNMALKNLPANIANEVKVYDKRSEYGRVADFDDGNTTKVVNITTIKGSDSSQVGKAYAGAGTDDRYKVYGMFNHFKDDIRFTLFTQLNNVNEQNFSMIDLLSATGTVSSSAPAQSPYSKGASNAATPTATDNMNSLMTSVSEYGVTNTRAGGTNFSDEWAKGKMKFSGHYLFNSASNHTDYDIFDEYFGPTTSDNAQKQNVGNTNLNHRFNAKYEYDISSNAYLMIRPSLTYQRKNEQSVLTDWTRNRLDKLDTLLLDQDTRTDQDVISTSDEVLFVQKLSDKGNALSVNGRFSYVFTSEDINMDISNYQTEDVAKQKTSSYNIQKTYTATLSYLHPIGRYARLKTDAGWNKTFGVLKRKTELKSGDDEDYSTDKTLSGSTWSNFGGWLGNMSLFYERHSLNLSVGTELHVYDTKTTNDRMIRTKSYLNLLPYAFMRLRFNNQQSQFIAQYRSEQRFPGLQELQDAINNSNAMMAIRGNNRLRAANHHTLNLRLQMPNSKRETMFAAFCNAETAKDYIGIRRSLSSTSFTEDGDRRNSEVYSYLNVDGYWAVSSLVAYGFPINLTKATDKNGEIKKKTNNERLNINFSTMFNYTHQPGYWDKDKCINNQWNWSSFLTVASNISTSIDFILDSNVKYTSSRNNTFADMDVDYWAFSYGGQFNLQLIPQLKVMLEGGHTSYVGSGTSQFNALISNGAIGYKFIKEKLGKGYRAELRFEIHDIFGQDNNFYQTTTEMYRRAVKTNILGRYGMLTLIYNLNTLR